MDNKILVTPEVEKFLTSIGTVVRTKRGNTYYHFPFWISKGRETKLNGIQYFKIHDFEHIPQELKHWVTRQRRQLKPKTWKIQQILT